MERCSVSTAQPCTDCDISSVMSPKNTEGCVWKDFYVPQYGCRTQEEIDFKVYTPQAAAVHCSVFDTHGYCVLPIWVLTSTIHMPNRKPLMSPPSRKLVNSGATMMTADMSLGVLPNSISLPYLDGGHETWPTLIATVGTMHGPITSRAVLSIARTQAPSRHVGYGEVCHHAASPETGSDWLWCCTYAQRVQLHLP